MPADTPAYDPATDPVQDPNFPRIGAYDPATDPEWPQEWGGEPTERDQAAIDTEGDQA